jgi:purine-binding chemotaxis protein CheW
VSDDFATTRNAKALALDFDRTFADPRRATVEDMEGLLALSVDGDAFAVRLRDVTGLIVDRKIVALPSPISALLGIVGLRNGIAPVYSLDVLLGYATSRDAPRWLLLVGAGPLFGLAFEDFDGHRQIARADVSSAQGETPGAHVPESVRIDDIQRGLLSIAALTETIKALVADNARNKER